MGLDCLKNKFILKKRRMGWHAAQDGRLTENMNKGAHEISAVGKVMQ